MRIRLEHVVFALIIASILNLAIAWLCIYYAVPGYRGSFVLSADEFDKASGLVTERDHDLAIAPWIAFGVTELDCFGPWYNLETESDWEEYPASESAYRYDELMEENILDHDPLEQNGLRRQLKEIMYKRHSRIDAGWPMCSFRGFVSGGLKGPFNSKQVPPLYKQLPQHELGVIAIERSVSNTTMNRYLPYMPIWFGLIVNTLVYAILILAIMWILLTVRAMRRLRRNLCPHCKYPIGVSDVCTECGYDLKSCVARA